MENSNLTKETTQIALDVLKDASKKDPLRLFDDNGCFVKEFSKISAKDFSPLLKITKDILGTNYVEYDPDDDGIFERKAVYFNDVKFGESIDFNGDGNDEFRFYFQGDKATLKGFALDANSNGIAECEEKNENNKICKIERDDLTGYIITQIKYDLNGKKISAELDNDKNGIFDYKITYDKSGKPIVEKIN